MKCSKVIESLGFESRRSNQPVSLAVRKHLDQCGDCQRQVRLDRVLGMLLTASKEEIEPSPFFASRVTARLSGIRSDVDTKRGMFVWWEALRQLAPPIIAVLLVAFALSVVPWAIENKTKSVGIEDLAIHNASIEERLVLSNEELSQARVNHDVLPLER